MRNVRVTRGKEFPAFAEGLAETDSAVLVVDEYYGRQFIGCHPARGGR
jgi:hypothetical protein